MATRLNVTGSGRLPLSYPPRAGFEAQLTNSVIPTSSVGAITYTRATPATVQDHEGRIVNVKSGEARFEGARRVQNGLPYSQTLTDASWITGHSTVTLDTQTINGIPVYRLINDATLGTHYTNKNVSFSFVAGNKYIISCIAKAGTSNYIQLLVATGVSSEYVNFDLSTGTATAGNTTQSSSVSLGNGFYRISLSITAIASGVFGAFYSIINSASASRYGVYSGAGEYVLLTATQFEDVTGQSIQTVGDYVSTNVLSSPFHGAMVDGVKYFNTTLAGDTISASTLKGVLIEGATTNLFTESNTFSSWTKNFAGMTVTPNQGTGLDGANSLWKIIPGVGSALQSLTLTTTVTAAVHTYTVYAKAGENGYLQLLTSGAISSGYVNFDLFTGTIGASSLWTGSITPVSGLPGVYKCVAITNTLIATSNSIHLSQVPTSTTGRAGSMVGDGVSGLYVWGAQLELGTFTSSHLFTTGSTVTRNADVLSYNASNAVSSSGAAYLEFTMGDVPSVGVDRRVFGLTANTNNRLQITGSSITTNTTIITVGNGSSVLSTNLGNVVSTNTYSKVAVKWTNGGVANMFQNGSKSTNIASPQVAVTQVDVGNVGGAPLYGYIKNLKVWKSPPSDSELQALTTL